MSAIERRRGALSALLLLLLLLLLGEASLERPEANGTWSLGHGSGISQRRVSGNPVFKPLKSAPVAARLKSQMRPELGWSQAPVNSSGPLNTTAARQVATPASTNERPATAPKYSSHYVRGGGNDRQDDSKSYQIHEDYEQQLLNHNPEYYPPFNYDYEDKYNIISEDPNSGGYDNSLADPWRQSYIPPEPGYYEPPVADDPYYMAPPAPLSSTRGCHCPTTTSKRLFGLIGCDNPNFNDFLNLLTGLGQNLWGLAQLTATSSLPFLITLIAVKIVLVPLKILKFIKLVKLLVKFFVILPLFMRIVSPALSQLSLPNVLQMLQEVFPGGGGGGGGGGQHRPHPHHRPQQSELEGREHLNGSVPKDERADEHWDLRACPSRVACEAGAFLATATHDNFPQGLSSFLARKADRAEARAAGEDSDEEEDEDDDEDEDLMRNVAFKAFLIALGKRWTQEKCEIYSCWVLT